MEGYRVQRDLLQTQIKLHAGAAGGAGRRLGPRGVLARHGSPGDRASALWDDNVKLGQIASSRALLQTGCLCGRAQAGLCFLARSCSHAATTHGQALQTRPSSECLPLAVVPRSSGLWAAGCLPIAPTPSGCLSTSGGPRGEGPGPCCPLLALGLWDTQGVHSCV